MSDVKMGDKPDLATQYKAYAAKMNEFRDLKKAALRDNIFRRARKRRFADGSETTMWQGMGRYRRYGRYGRRRFRPRFWKRRTRRWGGRGGYFADALGAAAGWINKKFIPSSWGLGSPESWQKAVSGISSLGGLGNYYSRPVTRGYGGVYIDQDVPQVTNPGGTDGGVLIRHREYIQDVVSPGSAFNISQKLRINPGNSKVFPWLSQIAQNFTQYKLQGCVFHFKSSSGALSTSQALGEIIMAINYNSTDAEFTTKQQMLNEIMATSKVPSEDALCPVECDPKQTTMEQMYISSDQLPSGQDPRFYDIGDFYIATQGQPSGPVVLGELWVSYQVELFKPQLPSNITSNSIDKAYRIDIGETGPETPLGIASNDDVTTYVNTFNATLNQDQNYILIPGDFIRAGEYYAASYNYTHTLPTTPRAHPSLTFTNATFANINQSDTVPYDVQTTNNDILARYVVLKATADDTPIKWYFGIDGNMSTSILSLHFTHLGKLLPDT